MQKYGNRKVIIDGIVFDSQREAQRYCELKLLIRAGHIKNLRLQEEYTLIPSQFEYNNGKQGKCIERAVKYIADFVYTDNKTGETVVEDVKGMRTKEYIIKRKLMLYKHGIRVREV